MLIFNQQDGFDGFTTPDGHTRLLNLRPPKAKASPRLAASFPIMDRKEVIQHLTDMGGSTNRLASFGTLIPRYNQMNIGECEPVSEVECVGMLRAMMGLPFKRLSPSFVYAHINNGFDQGASVGDGLAVLQQFGTPSEELCPTGKFFLREQITSDMYADARNHRAIFAFHCPTIEEIWTAHFMGAAIVHGVVVGNEFSKFDSMGRPGMEHGAPNHAVSIMDLVLSPDGQIDFLDLNHWGEWGPLGGLFHTSESAYGLQTYQDAIAYQTISVSPTEMGGFIPASPIQLA